MSVSVQRRYQLVEAEVICREAELDRPDAQGDKQVALAHVRRPFQQKQRGAADPAASDVPIANRI